MEDRTIQTFIKLFSVKIPVIKHSEYYIKTLMKSQQYANLNYQLDITEKLCNEVSSVREYKQQKIKESLKYFDDKGWKEKFNSIEYEKNVKLETKSFNPEDGKMYLSLDIREANWTTFKYMLDIDEGNWLNFSMNKLGYKEALALSKGFRQYIFGNLNPKRIALFQKHLTLKHLKNYEKLGFNIVSVNSDEIIFEISNKQEYDNILKVKSIVKLKPKVYVTNFIRNYEDTVRVNTMLDENLNKQYKTLSNVRGDRYFIHFKSIILEEELTEYDTLFMNDKKLAKWIL